ncbi:MAG TPA: hypothetical protein VK612_10045 [Pyrinomonadaceae bacterium]|nr:hypothetical protein [Pyrinomonadaceae bacterium]
MAYFYREGSDKTFHYGEIRDINVSIRPTFQKGFQRRREHLMFFDKIDRDA